jgi:hypothetical protein
MEKSITQEIIELAKTQLPEPKPENGPIYIVPIMHTEIYGMNFNRFPTPQPHERGFLVEFQLYQGRWEFQNIR